MGQERWRYVWFAYAALALSALVVILRIHRA
jgi:hypothetical protein